MPASTTSVSELINRHPQILPWLLSSSAIGILLSLKKFCTAVKSAIMAGLGSLVELQRALCDCISKCDANWWRCKNQLAEHRRQRNLGDLIPKRGTGP